MIQRGSPPAIICAAASMLVPALLVPCMVGCGQEESKTQGNLEREGFEVLRYVTRGQVVQIPASAINNAAPDDARMPTPLDEFLVRHERIPSFRNTLNEAEPNGMPAMTMPFPLADGVDLIDVSPGDKVQLEFFVFYDRESGMIRDFETRTVTPLPADTELTFGNADDEQDAGETP